MRKYFCWRYLDPLKNQQPTMNLVTVLASGPTWLVALVASIPHAASFAESSCPNTYIAIILPLKPKPKAPDAMRHIPHQLRIFLL